MSLAASKMSFRNGLCLLYLYSDGILGVKYLDRIQGVIGVIGFYRIYGGWGSETSMGSIFYI